MSGAGTVADGICRYFGGAYVPEEHSYRTPQISVAGMAGPVFRRSPPKRDDHAADYGLGGGAAAGIAIGCCTLVMVERGLEKRVAVAGAVSGLKQVSWTVRMHSFIRATVAYVEDAQDAVYSLLDAIRGHIEADRTCGTGGFEAGYGNGFQVGEGGEPWMRWEISPLMTTGKDLSKGYLLVEFAADQYIQA